MGFSSLKHNSYTYKTCVSIHFSQLGYLSQYYKTLKRIYIFTWRNSLNITSTLPSSSLDY